MNAVPLASGEEVVSGTVVGGACAVVLDLGAEEL
jgi:hypothetical protein